MKTKSATIMQKILSAGNLLIIILLLISGYVWYQVYKTYTEPVNKELEITFLNVGQGDSIFIRTPDKRNILIDGGTRPAEWSSFDAGKYVVVPFLKKKRIRKLDLVIATHPDLDHIGGLLAVLQKIPVDTFIDSGTIATTQTYEDLLKIIKKKKITYRIAQKNETLPLDSNISAQVFSPISPAFKDNPNDNSIVIKLIYGNFTLLLTGDIGKIAESLYIEEYGEQLHSDILKSPHHGSKSSSSRDFLDYITPETIIISCGKNNPFGHPAAEVIARYQDVGAKILRTDECGHIIIRTDGKNHTITTQY